MGRVMDAEGGVTPEGVGGKNFSAAFGGRKISPGAGTGKGGGVENFFTRGIVY